MSSVYGLQLVTSLDAADESLSVIHRQMSSSTSNDPSTTSYDVNELRQQLDNHDALMQKLTLQAEELHATRSLMQALDTDIAGKSAVDCH